MSGIFAPELWPFVLGRRPDGRRGRGRGCGAAGRREHVALARRRRFDHPDGVPDGALGWLHFGKVPILVILVIFLTTFALAGFIAQFAARAAIGVLHAAPAAVALAFVVGGVRGSRPRRCAEPGHPARRNHRGVRCEPRRPDRHRRDRDRARRQACEARVRDQHGTSHYVMVEPEGPDQALESGASILLVRHLSGRRFHAIPNPKPELL